MHKPHIRVELCSNVPLWRVVYPEGQDRDSSPTNTAAAWFVHDLNTLRLPHGFPQAWREANPGTCECRMPWPVKRACSLLDCQRVPDPQMGEVRT